MTTNEGHSSPLTRKAMSHGRHLLAGLAIATLGLVLAGCGDLEGEAPANEPAHVVGTPTAPPAPSQSASPSASATSAEPEPSLEPTEEAMAVESEEPAPEPDTDPQFDTCGDAKDAGYGPYVQGTDPEYDWYRDRDKDGVVCE